MKRLLPIIAAAWAFPSMVEAVENQGSYRPGRSGAGPCAGVVRAEMQPARRVDGGLFEYAVMLSQQGTTSLTVRMQFGGYPQAIVPVHSSGGTVSLPGRGSRTVVLARGSQEAALAGIRIVYDAGLPGGPAIALTECRQG